ncbi:MULTISPECIES: hypothetical protein [unclassified Paenibacillus]|nr:MULTISPECIES: hypothetical protein [unclassified Paenibacillus]MCM3130134.1 hypothetical protein [Paenibacillus sp. MER 78]
MKSVISKFVKTITIQEYFCTLSPFHNNDNFESIEGYFQSRSMKSLILSRLDKRASDNKQIIITDHALQRWNERVSSSRMNFFCLQGKLNLLFNQFGRVELQPNGVGIIDREIIFTYENDDENIIITTFYGRLSQIHSLHHFEALRNYNAYSSEFLDLDLSPESLNTLPVPPIPFQRMIFRGNTSTYLIEKYTDGSVDFFVLIVLEGADSGSVREFYSNQPGGVKLEKSVRRALLLLGNEEFVYRYVEIHHPHELRKQLDRLNNRF